MSQIDRYTCEEAFRCLDDYLDRELDPEQMECVRQHLETCAMCASEIDFEQTVIDDVRGKLRRIRAPGDLMTRISALIASARGAGPDPS
ncbi:MAG TPA: zf-HC2 domain-containing protein [Longimicrobium sp.]|nr:zf-HC2 domain-containing protein [Longimicrobium sp.]